MAMTAKDVLEDATMVRDTKVETKKRTTPITNTNANEHIPISLSCRQPAPKPTNQPRKLHTHTTSAASKKLLLGLKILRPDKTPSKTSAYPPNTDKSKPLDIIRRQKRPAPCSHGVRILPAPSGSPGLFYRLGCTSGLQQVSG